MHTVSTYLYHPKILHLQRRCLNKALLECLKMACRTEFLFNEICSSCGAGMNWMCSSFKLGFRNPLHYFKHVIFEVLCTHQKVI